MKFLSMLVLILFCFSSEAFAHSKHILLLQSYNKGLVWTDNITQGVEDVLTKSESHYELTTEYMDTKKINSADYMQALYRLFVMKMEKQKFDIIIAADNEAVEFIMKYKDSLFKGIPLVYSGIDKRDPGLDLQKILDKNIPLVLESKEIGVNMNFIANTLPNLKELYIINDYTGASVLVNHTYRKEAEKLERRGIKTVLNFDGNLQKIKEDIKNLPKDSAILFGSLFRDKYGNYIPYYDVNEVLNTSKVPLFSISDSHFGKGVIGGYLLKGYEIGEAAAKEAIAIINGEKKARINPVIVPSKWCFDYRMLKKYRIDLRKLPNDAKIINLPQTFFEKNKKLVEYAFILFPFLLISLIFAIINNYQKYKLSQKLKAQSELQLVLLNNIQSSIFWIDNQNRVKGCNNLFCSLLNISRDEIVGKEICQIFHKFCNLPIIKSLQSLEEIEFTSNDRVYNLTSQIFMNNKGENGGIVSIITDITDKKQLEVNTQFIVQQSKLSEIGEMLSAIVHQWKNPLVELSAVAHKMLHYDKKEKLQSKDVKEFYDVIMTQTIYMSETIDGFRDFVRPSNKPKVFNVDTGLKEVLMLLSHSLKYSHIELDYINKAKECCFAYGYPNEFKQVVVSIINNARDAIVEAKERDNYLKGKIKLTLEKTDKNMEVYIEDNGDGIKDDILNQIFSPFFTTKTKGDGFGLYMAKLIIENKMEGKIDISNTNSGAKVSIAIPISESIN